MSNCESCPSKNNCSKQESCTIENNPLNHVKNIIGIMSGKGGVGKSTVSALIARKLRQKGYNVGVLDADITGPSIPRLLRIEGERAHGSENGIIPVVSEEGIKVISLNLVLEDENAPVLWRGPMIGGAVKQFWSEVLWGELDYLIIDMPPGTGDVALTVMQSIPLTGIIMVSVPQEFVTMIVTKAVNMARRMDVKVLGVVENMSYINCPCCGCTIDLFDKQDTDAFVKRMGIELLGELPMVRELMNLSKSTDKGLAAKVDETLDIIADKIINTKE